MLRFQGRLCVSNVDDLRKKILEEAHSCWYFINSGANKMYCALQEVYWWNQMKDIVRYMVKFPNCKQVKVDHQRLGGSS